MRISATQGLDWGSRGTTQVLCTSRELWVDPTTWMKQHDPVIQYRALNPPNVRRAGWVIAMILTLPLSLPFLRTVLSFAQ